MDYDNDNIFAKILRGELPSAKVYEDDDVLAFMDVMPRSDGHVLVIPKSPARNMLDATPAQLSQCMNAAQKIGRAMQKGLGAEGITIIQSNESAGDQEVFHLHFHVLARYEGIRLRRPGGEMAKPEELKAMAERIMAGF